MVKLSKSLEDLFLAYSLFVDQRSFPKIGSITVCFESSYSSGDLSQRSVETVRGWIPNDVLPLVLKIQEV